MKKRLTLLLITLYLCVSQTIFAQELKNTPLTYKRGSLFTMNGVKLKRSNANLYLNDPIYQQYQTAVKYNNIGLSLFSIGGAALVVGSSVNIITMMNLFTKKEFDVHKPKLVNGLTYTGASLLITGQVFLLLGQFKLISVKTKQNESANSLSGFDPQLSFGGTSSGLGFTVTF